MRAPLITIITPTLNRAGMLREALSSVEAQGFADLEHVVIDGGSTDETPEVLAEFPGTRLVSEPDRGVYDALNKGLKLARGEFILQLNSDDRLAAGALVAAADAFNDPTVDVVTGQVDFFEVDGIREQCVGRLAEDDALALTPRNVTLGIPAINARFFRRDVYSRVGLFDLKYQIAADREWLLRLALTRPRGIVLGVSVCQYRRHADSMTIDRAGRNASQYRHEHLSIAEEYLSHPDLADDARDALRTWHKRESVCEAQQALLRGRFRVAWQMAARGGRHNAAWPLAFFSDGFRGLAERLRRRPMPR